MLTNNARIIVIAALFCIAIFSGYVKVLEISVFCIGLIALVIYGYFKEGTIILAAKQYHKKNYEQSKSLLLSIKNPQYLSKKRIPYYYYLLGLIETEQLNFVLAEEHLTKSVKLGLKSNDMIKALMHLSNISLRNKEKQKGLFWISEAEKLKIHSKSQNILNNIKNELIKINE